MDLVKWNPWREMDTFRDRINRFFEEPFLPSVWFGEEPFFGEWKPAVDIYDDDDKMVIKAELPGVDKKDIEVDLKDRVLTIKGERSQESETKEENYYRRERAYGKFQRSFTLPGDYDPDKVKAEYKDGVLHVEIPKLEEVKPKKITVH
ncbi:MAG: Hsp20/alpha crystallin family protein [Deltaproteobacteria bacterium]|nr:Hsp20/alpha crystallin family protein [Deltaproteobacteria bacterium]